LADVAGIDLTQWMESVDHAADVGVTQLAFEIGRRRDEDSEQDPPANVSRIPI
jgi:hypothetical protein